MIFQRKKTSIEHREKLRNDMTIKYVGLKLKDQDKQIIERFGHYKSIVENLVEKYIIETSKQDLVSCTFTNDSTRILAVMMESEMLFSIVMFCTETYKMRSSLTLEGNYIKAKRVSQNNLGSLFAIPFI